MSDSGLSEDSLVARKTREPAARRATKSPQLIASSASPSERSLLEPASRAEAIQVRGARTHNLKNVDLDLPRDRLVVLTGVSGSGKSSLAFDTIESEGRRLFLSTLTNRTRHRLRGRGGAVVERIEGLPPTVAIDQRRGLSSPRATVATLAEIHEYLRVLYARLGEPSCPQCGRPITPSTHEALVERVLGLGEGRKVMVLAPLRQGTMEMRPDQALDSIRRAGLLRARVDGRIVELSEAQGLAQTHSTIDAVVDRLVVREGTRARAAESLGLAAKLGEGFVTLACQEGDSWRDEHLALATTCPECRVTLPPLEPNLLNFNSPQGCCPSCQGLGIQRANNSTRDSSPDDQAPCPDCAGTRLHRAARAIRINGRSIDSVCALDARTALSLIESWPFEGVRDQIASPLIRGIRSRLSAMDRLGLNYLTLDRAVDTLSGGELQRVRLSARLGTGLSGVAYVLDEPTAGLHPRDTARLLECLADLRERGNSVLVVEHDEQVMRAAQWLVDLGPGAGVLGGEVVAAGMARDLMECERSVTGAFLRGDLAVSKPPEPSATPGAQGWIEIHEVSERNLKAVTCRFPLGCMTAVVGVSGSGKSTLVVEALTRELKAHFQGESAEHLGWPGAVGTNPPPERLVLVDQRPLGRHNRAVVATAAGILGEIRILFAKTKTARIRGFGVRHFSYNAVEGRCPGCLGRGLIQQPHQRDWLTREAMVCAKCRGARYADASLQIRFKGKSIADVLKLSIDEAVEFFSEMPVLRGRLNTMRAAGLGYLALGQGTISLSGGEAQRLKLAAELLLDEPRRSVFILDEPTTGLHPADIRKLIELALGLTRQGHTVIVIEHDLTLIGASDWVIELGPEGGEAGGHLVYQGPPERLSSDPAIVTATAVFLRQSRASRELIASGPGPFGVEC